MSAAKYPERVLKEAEKWVETPNDSIRWVIETRTIRELNIKAFLAGYELGRRDGIAEAAEHVENYWQKPYAIDLDEFVFGEKNAPAGKMARHLTQKIPETIRALLQDAATQGDEEKEDG
jgi:hypothetical protein